MRRKVDEIYNTKEKVLQILKEEPETRASDRLLIVRFLERSAGKPLPEVRNILMNQQMPSTETIRRARQKLQENHVELRPNKAVQDVKDENELIFKTIMGGTQ